MTLFESLTAQRANLNYVIAISDEHIPDYGIHDPRITFVSANDLKLVDETAQQIYDKYYEEYKNHFRWAMKPILLKYLIKSGYEKAIFLDCDLFFHNSFDFLIQDLDKNNILLTPHWRSIQPQDNLKVFKICLDGLYNAGFVGINLEAIDFVDWWAKACAHKCEVDFAKGFFDDQGYLDVVPIYFDKVKILKHQGCNISWWNRTVCKRSIKNGKAFINEKWEIVFIHYCGRYVDELNEGLDPELLPYYETWNKTLDYYREKFNIPPPEIKEPKKRSLKNKILSRIRNRINRMIDE